MAPHFMSNKLVRIDYKTIFLLAQQAWAGFKTAALRQWDPAKAAKGVAKYQAGRRESRRDEVSRLCENTPNGPQN